jgi:hypothetical protein
MAKDLLEAFIQAAQLFNTGNIDEVGEIFDSDVIMKRVGDPGSVVGIGNVIAYLKRQKRQGPQLLNAKITFQQEKGTQGIVGGTADYRNRAGDSNTTPLQFTFVFARNDANGNWRLINLFAVPTK